VFKVQAHQPSQKCPSESNQSFVGRHSHALVRLPAALLTVAGLGAASGSTPAFAPLTVHADSYACSAARAPFGNAAGIILHSSGWSGALNSLQPPKDGATLDVYSNRDSGGSCANRSWIGSDNWGLEMQCTEFGVRVADYEWHTGGYAPWAHTGWNGAAVDMFRVAPSLGLQTFVNGSGSLPQLGDLLVIADSYLGSDGKRHPGVGHVGVVQSATGGRISLVGENQGYAINTSITYGGSMLNSASFIPLSTVTGWIRGQVNGSQSAPASPATLAGNVANLYHDVLQRTGSQSDIAGWVASIQKGTSITQAAHDFLYSPEYHTDEVKADYLQMLHRPADPVGLSDFANALNTGARNQDVLVSLATSSEFWTNQAGQTDQGFVTALYTDVLRRSPSSADVSVWMQQIANGETLTAVAQGFVNSGEFRTDLVNAWYIRYLNRPADPVGLNSYVGALNSGARDDDVIVSLVTSPEYLARPAYDFVPNLYHDVLQRAGSQSDIAAWVASIQKGTSITQAAHDFLYSPEYHTDAVKADYLQMLHRPADPVGLSDFANTLNSGARNEDVLLTMATSAEFWTRQAGQTNQGFVTALYADILQRTPSSADVSSWVQNIQGGETLAAVAQAFLTSPEYRTDLVNAWYLRYLNRPADPGGLSSHVGALNSGARDDDVIVGMVTSPEYVAK
jgi:hypothetical protein